MNELVRLEACYANSKFTDYNKLLHYTRPLSKVNEVIKRLRKNRYLLSVDINSTDQQRNSEWANTYFGTIGIYGTYVFRKLKD